MRTQFLFTTLFFIAVFIAAGCKETKSGKNQETAPPQPKSAAQIQVENLAPTLDSAIHGFFARMAANDTSGLRASVFQYNEYVSIYPYTPQADSNPNSPAFIAQLFEACNGKHLRRWMYEFTTRDLSFSHYKVEKPAKNQGGFEYIKGIRLYVKDSNGKEEEFPVFKTAVKLKGGYKIWSILDT
jgi:hypothetical protein